MGLVFQDIKPGPIRSRGRSPVGAARVVVRLTAGRVHSTSGDRAPDELAASHADRWDPGDVAQPAGDGVEDVRLGAAQLTGNFLDGEDLTRRLAELCHGGFGLQRGPCIRGVLPREASDHWSD
jgi:hypothetical protein